MPKNTQSWKKSFIFGHFWVQNTIKINFWKLKFVLQIHLTFVITSQKFEKFQLTKKLKNFMKKWLKIEIFLIFASFFFKNFCFTPPPLKQKISNGSGHICECSYSSLGALRGCICKRHSKNFFYFAKNSCYGQKKIIQLKLMITNAHQIFLNGVFKSHYSSTILEIEKKMKLHAQKPKIFPKILNFFQEY